MLVSAQVDEVISSPVDGATSARERNGVREPEASRIVSFNQRWQLGNAWNEIGG
jgi:hypothetical protein